MNINTSSASKGAAVLKWLAILAFVALGAVAAFFYLSDSNARVELEQARAQAEESAQQVQQLQQAQTQTQAKPADDNSAELVRLRGDVAKYRAQEKQFQTLQSENQQLRTQMEQLRQASSEAAALRSANQQFQQAAQDQTFTVQCIGNLRAIANAKQQWAAQNVKGPADMPMDVDLFPKHLPQKPMCPKGGVYTLGTVNARPTCTVPGHTY
jgi:hypothetical protein